MADLGNIVDSIDLFNNHVYLHISNFLRNALPVRITPVIDMVS